jgi:hypothetical protein
MPIRFSEGANGNGKNTDVITQGKTTKGEIIQMLLAIATLLIIACIVLFGLLVSKDAALLRAKAKLQEAEDDIVNRDEYIGDLNGNLTLMTEKKDQAEKERWAIAEEYDQEKERNNQLSATLDSLAKTITALQDRQCLDPCPNQSTVPKPPKPGELTDGQRVALMQASGGFTAETRRGRLAVESDKN